MSIRIGCTSASTCQRCGKEIVRPRRGKVFCSRKCGWIGDADFISVDGEGTDRPDGAHDYIMLSVGDRTLTNRGYKLTHDQIFAFLWEAFLDSPNAVFIGFYLGYDFTQWTRSLPEDAAYLLWSKDGQASRRPNSKRKNRQPEPVIVDGMWEIDVLAKRRFKLRPHTHSLRCPCGDVDSGTMTDADYDFDYQGDVKSRKSWMYICDTGPFWQSSFLTAINPAKWSHPVASDQEYEIIKAGKSARSITMEYGDTSEFPRMREYNTLENEILTRITRTLRDGFAAVDLSLSRGEWYGPGRTAHAWLSGFDAVSRETVAETVPVWFRQYARETYYGGWFEQFVHGHIPGTTYEYDINSAYPYIIANLPCLLHGTYRQGDGAYTGDSEYVICDVTYKGSDPYIGGMPHRRKDGTILRPSHGRGRYWLRELEASRRAGLIDSYEIHHWAEYIPCDCPPPLAKMRDLYNLRLQVGKNTPQGRALKLLYNSAYGKFAQSVGSPKFGNPTYASLITSGCRTMILDAIASHPDGSSAVTMVATDGVYFTAPHPGLTISPEELGMWDCTEKYNLTQFMPGVYWDDKARKAVTDGGQPAMKSRGVSARDLAPMISGIDLQFSVGMDWPRAELEINFAMVSATQAIAWNKWALAGTVQHGMKRQISADPKSKRLPGSECYDGDMLRTAPYPESEQLESVPYERMFGDDDTDYETPNGTIGDMMSDILREANHG